VERLILCRNICMACTLAVEGEMERRCEIDGMRMRNLNGFILFDFVLLMLSDCETA
jgi:hypothetical protein